MKTIVKKLATFDVRSVRCPYQMPRINQYGQNSGRNSQFVLGEVTRPGRNAMARVRISVCRKKKISTASTPWTSAPFHLAMPYANAVITATAVIISLDTYEKPNPAMPCIADPQSTISKTLVATTRTPFPKVIVRMNIAIMKLIQNLKTVGWNPHR